MNLRYFTLEIFIEKMEIFISKTLLYFYFLQQEMPYGLIPNQHGYPQILCDRDKVLCYRHFYFFNHSIHLFPYREFLKQPASTFWDSFLNCWPDSLICSLKNQTLN